MLLKMNRYTTDSENIFTKHIFNKGLVSRTHREILRINKTTSFLKKAKSMKKAILQVGM